MTTRDHLVYGLQEQYSFTRDVLPQVDLLHHDCASKRLCRVLQEQRDGLRGEMEVLDRALNLLGGRFRDERSLLAPALKEGLGRFRHQMNPSREQFDIQAALLLMQVIQISRGVYQGTVELARAIGEQDVALLLEENLHRQTQGLKMLLTFLPQLAQEVTRAEARRAA